MRYYSPLRYPGGKLKIAPFLKRIIHDQHDVPKLYAEPYAGGAGAALHLLCSGVVERVSLNDLNYGIAAFWRAVFWDTSALVELIRETPVTLDEWHRQQSAYLCASTPDLMRGFATFYLNRTNRSGILGARPIGGLQQDGDWKLDARFGKTDLISRIEHLSHYRDVVSVSSLDGNEFIKGLAALEDCCFAYIDPPYLKQGEELYMKSMRWEDHLRLAKLLHTTSMLWVLTYDTDSRVAEELYPDLPCARFGISHFAAKQHFGDEYLIVPRHVRVASLHGFGPREGQWLPGRAPDLQGVGVCSSKPSGGSATMQRSLTAADVSRNRS